ncbi:MAG: CDP-alcohol phosphatidyltransferase family protein [Candidatus Krumholzibacteriota bacterium]
MLVYILKLDLIKGKQEKGLRDSFGFSNLLTTVRILASIPILVSFFKGYPTAAFVIYAVAEITDVVDGFLARRYSQTTILGVIIDPVGDMLTTEAVLFCLWRAGEVPGWLFALLSARYLEFFLGWILLLASGKRTPLASTIAGKIVGIVQFTGIMLIVSDIIFRPFDLTGLTRDIIIYTLGISFITVIISQTLIGLIAFRGGENHSSATEGK